MDYLDPTDTANTDTQQANTADSFAPQSNPYGGANPFAPENAASSNNPNLVTSDLNNSSTVNQTPAAGTLPNGQPASSSVNPIIGAAGALGTAALSGSGGINTVNGQNISGGGAAALQGSQTPGTMGTIEQGVGLARTGAGLVGSFAGSGAGASVLGSDAGEVGQVAGEVGTAAGYVAAPLAVYNFVKNWQSGQTGSDAIQGAEAGAAVGSVVPGVGTVIGAVVGGAIGAISSFFGPGKADPEHTTWNNVSGVYASYTPAEQQQAQQLMSQNPAQAFQLLAGSMQAGDNAPGHSEQIQQVFGTNGETNMLNSTLNEVNAAITAGKIQANATPQQIYSQVVAPWLTSKGATINPNSVNVSGQNEGQLLQGVVTSLIGSWQSGTLKNGTTVGIAGQAATGIPVYGAKTAPTAVSTSQPAGGGGSSALAQRGNIRQLAKGGEVTPMIQTFKRYAKLKGMKGYADGGEVSVWNGIPSHAHAGLAQKVVNLVASHQKTNGQYPSDDQRAQMAQKVGDAYRARQAQGFADGGDVDADAVSGTATDTSDGNVDPSVLQAQQDAVNAQRTDAAQQVLANMSHVGGDVALAHLQGSNDPNALALAQANAPNIPVNAAQTNVDSSGRTQGTALTNRGLDVANEDKYQKVLQDAQTTATGAVALKNVIAGNDPNSQYSRTTVSLVQNSLKAAGAPPELIAGINGLSGVQAEGAAAAVLGKDTLNDIGVKRATALQGNAQAGLTSAQIPEQQARGVIAQNAAAQDNQANAGTGGGSPPVASGNPTGAAPTASGAPQTDDTTFGAPNRAAPSPLAASLSGVAAGRAAQNQGNQQYAQSLASGGSSRSQAEQNLDEMITQVEGINGPIGPGTSILEKIDPKRQLYDKLSQQYLAALGGQTDSARAGIAAGFPQLDRINDKTAFIKQLQIAKARLLKADALSNEYQRRGATTGDAGDLNPGAAYNSMKSYAFMAPDGHTVDIKAYGSTQNEKMRLANDILNAKKKGLTLQSADQ